MRRCRLTIARLLLRSQASGSTTPATLQCAGQSGAVQLFSRSLTSSAEPQPDKKLGDEVHSWRIGQLHHSTHSHLLGPDELTPCISAKEYSGRRARLMSALPPRSVLLLPSASIQYMSGVIPYPYRQDPDFFYLSGLTQRGVLMLQSDDHGGHQFTLFVEAPNPQRERWDGVSVDKEAAQHIFGADQVYHMHELPKVVTEAVQGASQVLFDVDRVGAFHQERLHKLVLSALQHPQPSPGTHTAQQTQGVPPQAATANHQQLPLGQLGQSPASQDPHKLLALRQFLHAMRLRKSVAEASLMRASATLAAQGLLRCMQQTRPGLPEFAIAATFEYECKLSGASRMAYPPVTASGVDATTIHYGRNDKLLQPGQLLLMDAGCEFFGYCSDVTRTWPVSGRFSSAQRDVYEIVLEVHRRCVEACKPGATLRQLHELSIQLLSEGIHSLGLCKDRSVEEIQGGLYREFYWHALGHWLGLDTHDTHLMGHDRQLQPGHVITIEPGLYIPDKPEYGALRGIGVRIEDVVWVSPSGCEIFSDGVPRSVAAIEEVVGSEWSRKE